MQRKGIHPKIRAELSELIEFLETLGYTCISSEYSPGAFGNFYLDLVGRKGSIRLIRDKSQYSIDGTNLDVTEDRDEFTAAVILWLQI